MLPVLTTTFAGLNAMFFRLTALEVGGAAAVAVKVTGLLSPVKVAVTDCGVDPPTLSFVLATPDALVVLCVGLTPPPPDATAQLMTTPGTAQLFASSALTLNSVGSGLLKYHACPSPPFFTSWLAAPGVQGPVPLLPPPPHASRRNPTPSTGTRFQHKQVMTRSSFECCRGTIDVVRTRGVGVVPDATGDHVRFPLRPRTTGTGTAVRGFPRRRGRRCRRQPSDRACAR